MVGKLVIFTFDKVADDAVKAPVIFTSPVMPTSPVIVGAPVIVNVSLEAFPKVVLPSTVKFPPILKLVAASIITLSVNVFEPAIDWSPTKLTPPVTVTPVKAEPSPMKEPVNWDEVTEVNMEEEACNTSLPDTLSPFKYAIF